MLINMLKDKNNNQILQIRNILAFLAVLFALYVFKLAQSVVIPIAIAMFCFVLITPFLVKLDKFKCPFSLTVLLGLLVVVLVLVFFIYALVLMANTLMVGIPNYVERVASLDKEISAYLIEYLEFPSNFSIITSLNIDWYGFAMIAYKAFLLKLFPSLLKEC